MMENYRPLRYPDSLYFLASMYMYGYRLPPPFSVSTGVKGTDYLSVRNYQCIMRNINVSFL